MIVTRSRSADDAWHMLGYWPLGLFEAGQAFLLTGLLFAGPLYERLIIDGSWEDWMRLKPISATWSQWPAWRNYVAVSASMLVVRRGVILVDMHIIGSRYRRVSFPLSCSTAAPHGQLDSQANDIAIASCIWFGASASFLRVPNHTSQRPTHDSHCQLGPAVFLHIPVRHICYFCVCEVRIAARGYLRPYVL